MSCYLKLWGKSDRREGGAWHPAAFHMLDVAACAERLIALAPARFERLARRCDVTPDALGRALVALVGIHDLGKFARAFQVKAPWLWRADVLGEMPGAGMLPAFRHDAILLDWLSLRHGRADGPINPAHWPLFEKWDRSPTGWSEVAGILGPVAGHHGEPVSADRNFHFARAVGAPSEAAAEGFLADWFPLVEAPALPELREAAIRDLGWSLVGLTVLSDWLGSNTAVFPPACASGADTGLTLEQYWRMCARPQARAALAAAGLAPIPPSSRSTVLALAGIREARPLQVAAETVLLPEGPLLIIVEDVTGAGKTEAALVLAHRLMQRGDATGLYMALPTMATANAMFERLQRCLANLFTAAPLAPSLALAHGRAWLNPSFRLLSLPEDGAQDLPPAPGGEPASVAAACADWIADDRRKAFLAQVGAGTIDQALLAILPARYQSLRLFGLADRVLVIDEAHSYDAYSGELLARLVRFQAAQGGSTILLSATLSESVRDKLVRAYRDGRGDGGSVEEEGEPSASYPLLTLASRRRLARIAVAPVAALRRTVSVERLPDVAAAEARLGAAHGAGMAVAYVRNAVQDAIETAGRLRAAGFDPLLFHARFAMGDRLAIEAEVKRLYGPQSSPSERRRRPLVATQVVEQSLDLDFDLMLTDLAPVDLLIQRAGRVWRHMDARPAATRPAPAPVLLVVSPDPCGPVAEGWLRALLPRAAAVYGDHGLLWRSARVLFEAGRIEAPQDLRRMVEAVYAPAPAPGLETPEALAATEGKAWGAHYAERAVALQAALKYEDGYSATGIWRDDAAVTTRLGEMRLTLRLARWEGGAVLPWCEGPTPRHAWALSEVDVPARLLKAVSVPAPFAAAVAQARGAFGRFDQDMPVAVLEPDGNGGWRAQGLDGGDRPVALLYDRALGLRIEPLPGAPNAP